jgi:hypothetical protein
MVLFQTLFEGVLVNYVVPGTLPPTTYSDDTTLMRFRVFTWVRIGDFVLYFYTQYLLGFDSYLEIGY